jgi:DHA1 family bicyclomycin/chloramphenicol resistance-like MFS transporter
MSRTFFLLALLAAFPPLSTDMYLPAIPHLKTVWNQPLMVVNLTLIGFFLTYCLFMLIYGPLSDRYGRRRPLLVGIGIYIFGSLLCALAGGVYSLIAARILQASGAASASALSLAMCKDLFGAKQRERIMAYIAVTVALAPMLAPVIGGWLIHFSSWRWVFVLQAGMGIVAWVGVFCMREPLERFAPISAGEVVRVYGRLLRNRRYAGLVIAMSLLVLPFFGFLAGSAEIYMGHFGMDERQFGYFFGFNALALMFGPVAFARLTRSFSTRALLTFAFGGIPVASIALACLPHHSPWSLALPMWALSFFFGMCRPPSNNLILEQVQRDVGAASALVIFAFMTVGAAGMGIISLAWSDKITVLGVLGTIVGAVTLAFWLRYRDRLLPVSKT